MKGRIAVRILILCLFLILSENCSRKIEFTEIKRRTTIINGQYYFDILVSNCSESIGELKSQMISFYNMKIRDLKSKGDHKIIAGMKFYKKTSCTSYFLNHDEEHTDAFDFTVKEIEFCNDDLGSITEDNIDGRSIYTISLPQKNGEAVVEILKWDKKTNTLSE
ncbi:hypothetical protein [Prevotella melaninogenica]